MFCLHSLWEWQERNQKNIQKKNLDYGRSKTGITNLWWIQRNRFKSKWSFSELQSKLLASVNHEEFSSWFTILYHMFDLPETCDAEVFPNKLKYGTIFMLPFSFKTFLTRQPKTKKIKIKKQLLPQELVQSKQKIWNLPMISKKKQKNGI